MQNWSKCYGQVTFKELLCLYLWLLILGNPAATHTWKKIIQLAVISK